MDVALQVLVSGLAAGAVYGFVCVARGPSGRALLRRATAALLALALARARQYDQFVGNPDPVGRSETRYVFVTGERTAAPRAAARPGDGSRSLA